MGEIYVDPPDYSILNPVAAGIVNLSLVVPLAHVQPYRGRLDVFFEARLKQLRHLAPRLAGLRAAGPLMAMGPLAYRVAEPRAGGVVLVGDAGGFYDPFTGEGLYTALRCAELLAEVAHDALRRGECSRAALAPYARARAARRSAARRGSRARCRWSSPTGSSPTSPRTPSRAVPRGSTRCWACSAISSPRARHLGQALTLRHPCRRGPVPESGRDAKT